MTFKIELNRTKSSKLLKGMENNPSIFEVGKVSVLIPCYQHGHLLSQAVESVLRQSYKNNEVIIVNDGSDDNTHEIAMKYMQKYPMRCKYISQENKGQALARKNGSALVCGEFLVTLDADDILEPKMMERCLESLKYQPEVAAVASDVWMVREDGKTILSLLNQSKIPTWPDILTRNSWGGIAGIMIRSQFLQKVGGFNFDGSPGAEDWDIMIRFTRSRQKLLHIPYCLARYRQSYNSYSYRSLNMLKGILSVLDYSIREDPRLIQVENVHTPIDISFYNQLRNRAVFFYYGMAVATRKSDEILGSILDYLVLSNLDLETFSKAYIKGLISGVQLQNTNSIYSKYFQNRGLEILQDYLEDKIPENEVKLMLAKINENLIQSYQQYIKNSISLKNKVKTILTKTRQNLSLSNLF